MNESFTLTLSREQLNVVFAGLQELPFKFAAPVVQEVEKQLMAAQVKADAAPAKTE